MLVRCTASNNHTGVQAGNGGLGGAVFMSQVAILGNVVGWNQLGSGLVFSYGDNTIEANLANNTPHNSTPKK
jgi:hypothetical protein